MFLKYVVTNDDLSKIMDTTDEWIQERTGIKERRWIDPKIWMILHQQWAAKSIRNSN